jgi:hypothetical protein
VTLQDLPDGLIVYFVPEVRERPGDSVIAPGSILFRKANVELFYFLVDFRSTRTLPFRPTVELICNKPPVPSEYCLRLDEARHFLENLPPELLADLR